MRPWKIVRSSTDEMATRSKGSGHDGSLVGVLVTQSVSVYELILIYPAIIPVKVQSTLSLVGVRSPFCGPC